MYHDGWLLPGWARGCILGGGAVAGVTVLPAIDLACLPYDAWMRTHPTTVYVVDEAGNPAQGVEVWFGFEEEDLGCCGTTDGDGVFEPRRDLRVLKLSSYSLKGAGYRHVYRRRDYYPKWDERPWPVIDEESNRLVLVVERAD